MASPIQTQCSIFFQITYIFSNNVQFFKNVHFLTDYKLLQSNCQKHVHQQKVQQVLQVLFQHNVQIQLVFQCLQKIQNPNSWIGQTQTYCSGKRKIGNCYQMWFFSEILNFNSQNSTIFDCCLCKLMPVLEWPFQELSNAVSEMPLSNQLIFFSSKTAKYF